MTRILGDRSLRFFQRALPVWMWLVGPGMISFAAADEVAKIEFNRDVRPILSDKCFACHGQDTKTREADLRLDEPQGAYDASRGKAAVAPGDLAGSELWARVTTSDPDLKMPPDSSHKELTEAELETLRLWIEQGAVYQKHWAFESPARPEVPVVAGEEVSPIDAFLLDRLSREGMTMNPEAEPEVLLRRVAFALTGLPPSAADREAFLSDREPGAYERMVDRFLESPHFGEEMARQWLDVARYADTHGLHLDNERQTWAYRDWVVQAYNRNLPFDQFTIEQLAGDLLPEPTLDQLVATGFNRCNVTTSEGGSIEQEFVFRYAVDRTSTMIEAWMGLTGGCAVCHDHKFDPLSQAEFYSLYAFFHSAADPAMDGNALLTQPTVRLETDDLKARLADLDARIAAAEMQVDQIAGSVDYVDPALIEPRPEVVETESVWMDDAFPVDGQDQSTSPTEFVSDVGGQPVHSGAKAIRRQADGLAQDVWQQIKTPLVLPENGRLFAHVWIDAANPPRSIMLQYHRDGWQHRAVWGDYEIIPWGAAGTTERVGMGALPEAGQWVRLEFPLEQVGLKAGDALTGFALTQHGGTVYWDTIGVSGKSDPASDPRRSFVAWWKSLAGSDASSLPESLRQVAAAGPQESSDATESLRRYYIAQVCVDTAAQVADAKGEVARLRGEREGVANSAPSTFIFRDLMQPRESFVMMRGAYDKPADPVEPNTPAILPPLTKLDPNRRANRLDLATWLVSDEHPLTARVAVNRHWQQFFGVGLVKTSADFGSQGEMPSHPELLDWLAIDFRENGWDVKRLVRSIVTSKAFRQSTVVDADELTRDPENRLLARGPRIRLAAEQIRDNALAVSGLLVRKFGGPGVKPYQPANIWEPVGFAGSNTRFYTADKGEALYRRSIYTFFKRTAPPPFMTNFDAPNREQSCAVRERSNTPLQALQLMNDVQHVEAARMLAQRILKEAPASDEARVDFVFREVLCRAADAEEMGIVLRQLGAHRERYAADAAGEEAARKLVSQGETPFDSELSVAELASWTLVANMVLNLDETLTRN